MDENKRQLQERLADENGNLNTSNARYTGDAIVAAIRAVVAEHEQKYHRTFARAMTADEYAKWLAAQKPNAAEGDFWYRDVYGTLRHYPEQKRYSSDHPFGKPTDVRMDEVTKVEPVPAAEALSLIAKWREAKQPAPASTPTTAPATAEAPERVAVRFIGELPVSVCAYRAGETFSDAWSVFVRSDIALQEKQARVKELEASLKIANDTISDLYTGLHELDEKCEQLLRK